MEVALAARVGGDFFFFFPGLIGEIVVLFLAADACRRLELLSSCLGLVENCRWLLGARGGDWF